MLKITNISERIITIGNVTLKPNESHIYETGPIDNIKHKIESYNKLNMIRLTKVDTLKVNNKKKSKK